MRTTMTLKPTKSTALLALSLFVTGMLSGCLGKRDEYDLPSIEVPGSFKHAPEGSKNAKQVAETAPGTVPQSISRWWRHFGNSELNDLIERGLANNYQLKAAIARIAQAHALAGVERADEWPELSASGSYEVDKPEGGVGSVEPGSSTSRRSRHLYQVGIEASYEVDLWGKNRAKTQAALERAWASLFDRETVALTLTADITQNFIEYLSLQDRIRTADWTQTTLTNMQEAVRLRVEGGEATNLQLAQQRAAVAASKAVIPVLELQAQQRINAIAVLIGQPPSKVKLKSDSLADIQFPNVNPGVPSRLIMRRPDIRQIESTLIAADADIDAARAELFPAVNLTAEAGYGARHLDFLFSPESFFFSAGATIAQIIFDAGRRESQIKYEEAQHQELVHNYVQSIYSAINEVENALVSIHYLTLRRDLQQQAVSAAVDAYGFSKESYGIGASDYLTLLDTERTLFTERDELHQVDFSRFQASVDLFRALGGSMEPEPVMVVGNQERPHVSRPPGYFQDEDAKHPIRGLVPNLPEDGHWVHVATLWSERAAWRHWRRLQQRFPDQLKTVKPEIQRQNMHGERGTWVSVLVGPYAGLQEANSLCATFQTEGNGCQVLTR